MRTEPPEISVPVDRQDDTSPRPTHHLDTLVHPEINAALSIPEYFLPPDGVDFRAADIHDAAVRQRSLDSRHAKSAGMRTKPSMATQAKGPLEFDSSRDNVEWQHRRLLSVEAIPGPLSEKTTTPRGFLQAG